MNLPTLEKTWKLAGAAFLLWLAIPVIYFGLKFVASLWQMMIMGVAIGM